MAHIWRIVVVLTSLALAVPAIAETRVALVVGNGAYAAPRMALPNPPADARLIAGLLEQVGFSVDLVVDGGREHMYEALDRFAAKAETADVALFYFAGHGIQDLGQNFLMPVDAELKRQRDLRDRFVPLDDVLQSLSQARGAKILVLDACRDNEAVDALRAAVPRSRSTAVSRGLAPMPKVSGMLVAFATQPGVVAADGTAPNSPFTEALARHLAHPGLELRQLLTRVRVDVAKATDQKQIPEVSDSLLGEVFLNPAAPIVSSPAVTNPAAGEIDFWMSVGKGGTEALYRSGLHRALAPRLVAVLEARLGPGHSAAVGDTRLISSSGRIEMQAEELAVTGPDGREVFFAPEARVELAPSSLVRGEVAIASLHLLRPRLVLRSPVDDKLSAAGPPASPVSTVNRDLLAHLVSTLDRLTAPGGVAAALEEVRMSSAVLVLDRGVGSGPIELDRLSVRLKRRAANGFALTIASESSVDRWSATMTSTEPTADGRVFDLGLDNVSLAIVARLSGVDPTPDYDATVSGHLGIRLDGEAMFRASDARLDLAGLTFVLPGAKRTKLAFDRVQLRGRWDGETRSFKLDPSSVAAGGGRVTLVGEAQARPVGSPDPWQIRLQGMQAELPGAAGDLPLQLDALTIRAAFSPKKFILELPEGHIVGPNLNVAMSGSVTFGDSSPGIAIGIAAAPMTASAAKRLWPFFLAQPVRAWVLQNVIAGKMSDFSMMADIKPGVIAAMKPFDPLPDQAIYIESTFSDGTMTVAPGLPPLLGASGRFRSSGHKTELIFDQARVEPLPGQTIAMRGRFDVAYTGSRYSPARVQFWAAGPLTGAAQLFTSGALGPNPLPPMIDPASVRGVFAAQSEVALTLGPPGEVPPIDVKVDGLMREVTIDKFIAGKPLESGEFRVVRNSSATTVIGGAKLGGATTQIEVRDEGPSGRREVLASATLDASARNKLGLPGGDAIRGPIAVKIKAPLAEGPIEVQADVGAAELDGLFPGLTKRAGVPGKMSFTMLKTPEAITLRDIAIDSGPASIRGADGPVATKLGTFRLSPNDDIGVSVEKLLGAIFPGPSTSSATGSKPAVFGTPSPAPLTTNPLFAIPSRIANSKPANSPVGSALTTPVISSPLESTAGAEVGKELSEMRSELPKVAAPSRPSLPDTPDTAFGQRAILYEESGEPQGGTSLQGTVVWRTELVSGGQGQPLETALRGEVTIPARNFRVTLVLRRNTDSTLPASHTIEVQFILPANFANAGIANVPGLIMKAEEQSQGAALAGLSVRVTGGFFLIGLSSLDSERSANEQLLRDRDWIDIPILYDNGRRAVLTLEKGPPGEKAFNNALAAWRVAGNNLSGPGTPPQ